MEDGCFNAIRLFHHAAYCFEHITSDDEGIFEKYIFIPTRVGFVYKANFGTIIIQLSFPTSQYHGQHATYDKVLRYINMLFTGLFTIEAILKIFGFGIKVCSLKIIYFKIFQFQNTYLIHLELLQRCLECF